MYKVKIKNECGMVLILFMCLVFFTILLIISSQNLEILTDKLKYFPLIAIFIIVADIIGIIYEISLIKKYKWLSKNGILIKNVPFTSYVDTMYMKGGPKYDTTIFVEYELETGEKVTLSRNWYGKKDLKKFKTIDILIDKNNPKKRHYIDFNIEKI